MSELELFSRRFNHKNSKIIFSFNHINILYDESHDSCIMEFRDGNNIIMEPRLLENMITATEFDHLECLAYLLSRSIEIYNLKNGTNYNSNEPIKAFINYKLNHKQQKRRNKVIL